MGAPQCKPNYGQRPGEQEERSGRKGVRLETIARQADEIVLESEGSVGSVCVACGFAKQQANSKNSDATDKVAGDAGVSETLGRRAAEAAA